MKLVAASHIAIVGLAPLFAQTTLNMSQDLVRLGISPNNLVPNQPSLDVGPLFAKAMNYASANQIAKVIADPGSYYFMTGTGGCYAPVPSKILLDFQGSDLYFADPQITAVCPNGVNIALQNFTIDYSQLPYTQVTVTSVDPAQQQVSFTVQPGWQRPSALNALGYNPYMTIYRANRVVMSLLSIQTPFADDKATIVTAGPAGIDYHALVGQIRPGDIAVIAKSAGIAVSGACDNCTFRNIRVYTAGTGATYLLGQSDLFERFYVMPRPGTDRLRSTGNDGIHFGQTGPNSVIRLCRVIRNGDDGYSPISAKFGFMTKQLDNRTFAVQGTPGAYEDGVESYYLHNPTGTPLPNGSTVQFERLSDGMILGNAVIVSQTAPQPVTGTRPNGASGPTNQVNLTFDRDLSNDYVGATVYAIDPNRRGGNLLLERNTVQQQVSGSGFNLYGLVNTTVKGNYVSRSAWSGVWIDSNTYDPYGDIPPSSGVTVTNNVIDRPNNWLTMIIDDAQFGGIQALEWLPSTRPMQVSPMQNVTISNNFIADPRRSAIWIGNTTGGSMSGNYILNPNNDPQPQLSSQPYGNQFASNPMVVDTSQNISTGNNTVDQTSSRMWITDTQFRELAAYGPGGTVRLNAYNLGTLANPSVTLTDADGNALPLSIRAAATHSLDILIPDAAALGGAYLTLKSGSAKYFGTLFLDTQDNVPALNGCTYEVSSSSTSVAGTVATLPVLVTTQAGCSYQALDSDAFVTMPAAASGTGIISISFAANVGAQRTTTIEIAGLPIVVTQAGAGLSTIQAIVDSWDYTAGVAPGAWVTITGANLATGVPQTWNLSETQLLPTTLGGVAVTFNGTSAVLYYISSTQINALVPASVAPGPVRVVVRSNGVDGPPFTITATATLPSIYALPNADGRVFFVTAALAGTGTLVGNSAVDARVARAVQPGDILDLYMIGLGATADASKFITNQVFAGAYPVSAQVTATVAGEAAQVQFAGLTSPGLYLVRIAVPSDIPAGPQPIQISAGGVRTSSSLVLMVGTP
jgi:uncharacterized protein (TIGR03437 family)